MAPINKNNKVADDEWEGRHCCHHDEFEKQSAMEAGRTGAPPAYKSPFPQRATSWLPIVDQGCCCCTLRTCNLVQGWMSLVS
ncbi:hypothetical protein FOCC_FOCC013279 [Frankliniella occidentalis]|nr:hypothetical protein FOCC_FOCC013279 [Frankliniella occidentalis]